MLKYKLGSVIVFVLLVAFCATLYSFYYIYSSNKSINENQIKYIEILRSKNKELIKNYYNFIENYFQKDYEDINFKLINDEDIVLNEFHSKNRNRDNIENILILDKNLEILNSLNENFLESTIDLMKEYSFDVSPYISSFYYSENIILQYIAFKNSENEYIVYIINNDIFDKLIKIPENYEIDIYNNQFQLIYSTKDNPEFISSINTLTKKILDGNTKTEKEDGNLNSYTFVDFETSSIYLNVSTSLSYINDKLKKIIINAIFLTVFISVIGLVTGSLYTKYTANGYESKSRVQSDSALLDYFGENILEAMIKVDDVIETLEKLSNLKQSLYESNNNLNSIRESDKNG
jgi:hypothetical protein